MEQTNRDNLISRAIKSVGLGGKNEPSDERMKAPIVETPDGISYLGVRLNKAENGSGKFVPKREQYGDYINDDFSLEIQKNIATAWIQGEPILIEGGTSIGKTTAVRKMASELGYEVHYANLNGATDVEDLMGRYIPNPNKRTQEDPEYLFADGKVTSGLRQEEGRVKVIILDEFNSAAPNILIRLHEVLDAVGRGEDVVLSEDASEVVGVDKNKTKIIALTNPPGKGYFGREPLDPAQLRRWVYIKAPSDLPDKTFSHSTDALFDLVPKIQDVAESSFLLSREQALLPEELKEVPGIREILAKYKEFHKSAKQLVKERRIAADQPQPFTFDDRMETRRVRDFVLTFYNGDINETFQAALRYFYSNKVESPADKIALEELIRHVEYSEGGSNVSKRIGLDTEDSTSEQEGERPKEFSREQRQELIERGYKIFRLKRRSAGEIIKEHGWEHSWHQDMTFLDTTFSRNGEVAISVNPFFPETENKTFEERELRVEELSRNISSVIRGTEAVMGNATDYLELATEYRMDTGKDLFIEKAVVTSTIVVHAGSERCVVFGSLFGVTPRMYADRLDARNQRIYTIPLIVPSRKPS